MYVTTLERNYSNDSTYLLSLLEAVARRINLPSYTVYGNNGGYPERPKSTKAAFTVIVIIKRGGEFYGFINRYLSK